MKRSVAAMIGNVIAVLCVLGIALAAGAYMYTFRVFEGPPEGIEGAAIVEFMLLPIGLLALLSVYFWLRSRELGRQSARRERAEWALKRSERSLVQAQRIARIGDWEYGIGGGGEARWSGETYRIFGIERRGTAPTYRALLRRVHPEDRGSFQEAVRRAVCRRHDGELEFRIVRSGGEVRDVHVRYEPLRGEVREPDRLVGTIHDITERKRMEVRLREAEERYRILIEHVPAAIYIDDVDETNSVIYRSPHAEEILGYAPEEFLSTPDFWQNLLHPEDRERVLAENEATNQTGEPFRVEYRMIHKDGHAVWLRDEAILIRDAEGRPRYWQGFFTDITERKEAETRYRTMVEEVPAMTYLVTQEPGGTSRFVYMSPQVEKLLGYTPEEYTGHPEFWKTILHPEDRERVLAADVKTGRSGEEFRAEYRMVARDGRVVWLRDDGKLVRDADGTQFWHGVMFDVTEARQVQQKLEEAEARYRMLVERMPVAVYRQEPAGKGASVTYMSPQIEVLTGYETERFTSDPGFWLRTVHPEDRERVLAEDERTDRTGEPFGVEYRAFRRDGSLVWRRNEAILVRDAAGRPLFWQGIISDVTDRKEAEEKLKEAEARYRTLVETIPAITYTQEIAETSVTTYVSPQMKEVFGYEPGDVADNPDLWVDMLYPEDRERVLAEDERTNRTGEPFSMEYRSIARDGRVVWTRDQATLVRDADGVPLYWQGVQMDITDQKLAEEQLEEAEARFRTLVEQIPAATYTQEVDRDFTAAYVSPRIEDLTGYRPEEFYADQGLWRDILHPEDHARVMAEEARTDESGEPFRMEYRLSRKDGRVVWVRDESVLVEASKTDRARFWQGVMFDVTDRKEAEGRLRESEARYRTLVEHTPAVTYTEIVAESGTTSYVSPQVEAILGYLPEELDETDPFWGLLHPEDRERVVAEDERANETGDPFLAEYRLSHKEGRVVWVRDESVLVSREEDGTQHWQGVLYDITERKALEKRLEHQAMHDGLTGLPNRSLFAERVGHALSRLHRRVGNRVAVMFLDLDDFKLVNDSLGHDAGDDLLVAVAERLVACVRSEDTVARFGGDEFTVLLEDRASQEEATRVAARILEGFEQPFLVEGRELVIAPSIGISMSGSSEDTVGSLLRDADAAMYRSKERGKGRYELSGSAAE